MKVLCFLIGRRITNHVIASTVDSIFAATACPRITLPISVHMNAAVRADIVVVVVGCPSIHICYVILCYSSILPITPLSPGRILRGRQNRTIAILRFFLYFIIGVVPRITRTPFAPCRIICFTRHCRIQVPASLIGNACGSFGLKISISIFCLFNYLHIL